MKQNASEMRIEYGKIWCYAFNGSEIDPILPLGARVLVVFRPRAIFENCECVKKY